MPARAARVVLLALSAAAVAAAGTAALEPGSGVAAAVQQFLAALDADQREETVWPFTDDERTDVHYAPIGLDGLRHGDLDAARYEAGEAVLRATLSPRGYAKVREIRLLERDVREAESFLMRPFGFRNPGRYFFAVFGDPGEGYWGYRYEGHHVSLNVTATPESFAVTPLFLGAQPRVAPPGAPSAGAAALLAEEELARALYASLGDAERARATLPYAADRGHMIGQVARITPTELIGLPRRDMTAPQQAQLDELLDRFVTLFNEPIAAERRRDVETARAGLHFAHVAADDPPNAFYTRVSGPGLLLEIDNTEDGDHVHAVWHLPGRNFGDDVLALHYSQEHGYPLIR